jgi:hypothetical protein
MSAASRAAGTLGALLLAAPLAADEQALRRFFEGRSVVVRIDMPATSDGVDVYPEREEPLDYGKLASRIRSSGVAVREGERIVVTIIKVKDDIVELHLGGGGFHSFHDASSSVSIPSVPKSSRERELDREVREETDTRRKRRLERERDELRREREREDARNRAIQQVAEAERRERDRYRALEMGSRFNVRFEDEVRADVLTSEGLMRVLSAYVEFPGTGFRAPQRPEDLRFESPVPADASETAIDEIVVKGMSRSEVEEALGAPEREDESREGALSVTVASYRRGQDRVEVTYVEDVVVRVAPTRR